MASLQDQMNALEAQLEAKQAAFQMVSQHSMLRQAYDRQLRELQQVWGVHQERVVITPAPGQADLG